MTAKRDAKLLAVTVLCLAVIYGAVAYVGAPFLWHRYIERHPAFDRSPRITQTGDGHPGDPLNIALVGSETLVTNIFSAAGWYAANALSVRSDVEIAEDTVLDRPYDEAPVSSLYLFGRKEDLAFELPAGANPRRRNHVRFWRLPEPDSDGSPIWIGAASYDRSVGFSHTTGQITHHIAPDVDTERDALARDLEKTADLADSYTLSGFQKTLEGRNGGGDPWHTDGALWIGWIK